MHLIGLDFGSTTTSALVAEARVLRNCVTGRRELGEATVVYRSEPVFTPLIGEDLDEARLRACLDRWIAESGVRPDQIDGGGAIITGLAAQRANAGCIRRLVRERFGEALIATADDPRLESWLAFMGNCRELSRADTETWLLNLDVGGGTTNLALGRGGEVTATGCYYVGARHVRFVPGTYRIEGLSSYARRVLDWLSIRAQPGDELDEADVGKLVDFYAGTLEALVSGDVERLAPEPVRRLEQVAFQVPAGLTPAFTFSGGVGELVYRHARGEPLPATTFFGDLGIDLAKRIVESPILSGSLASYMPATLGRATVYGLTLHNTEVSGATLFLPRPELLPLTDVPIVGRLSDQSTDDELAAAVELARAGGAAACLQVSFSSSSLGCVRPFGQRLSRALAAGEFPADRPLVLLVPDNVGKTLGQYASDWGRLTATLIVVDEVPDRPAHFLGLGCPREGIVPVSLFGWE
jgi:ethanolamine utilization protein EutA